MAFFLDLPKNDTDPVCVCVCVAVAFIYKFITAFTKLHQNHSPVCCLTHSTTRDLNPEIMYQ